MREPHGHRKMKCGLSFPVEFKVVTHCVLVSAVPVLTAASDIVPAWADYQDEQSVTTQRERQKERVNGKSSSISPVGSNSAAMSRPSTYSSPNSGTGRSMLSSDITGVQSRPVDANSSRESVTTGGLAGVWKVTIKRPGGAAPEEKLLFVRQKDRMLAVRENSIAPTFYGAVGDEVAFPVLLTTQNGKMVISLEGAVVDSSSRIVQGETSIAGVEREWKAERLYSVWMCSNHSRPVHTTTTKKGMKELTAKQNCQGWQPIPPDAAVDKVY